MTEEVRDYSIKADNKIFNVNRDYNKQELFMGEAMGLFDTVNRPFPYLWDLYKQALAQNWSEDEFDFSPCMKEFKEGGDAADMMIETIATQWMLDSEVSSTLLPLLAPFITNSELQALTAFNTYMECCLTKEHEVYVKDKGWTKINEVSVGDEVIQYHLETKKLSFDKVSNTIEQDYKGDLYDFSARNFRQITTDNHRMVLQGLYKDNAYKGIKKRIPTIKEAKDELISGHVGYIISGEKEGVKQHLTPHEKLLIAFQADGSYRNDPRYNGNRTGGIPVSFSFKRDDKKKNLEELIEISGYHSTFHFGENDTEKEGYKSYMVYIPLEMYEPEGWKEFSWIDIENVSASWCKEFIHELYKWDGCNRISEIKTHKSIVTYVNTNRKACEMVQLIAHMAGYRCCWKEYEPQGKGKKQVYQLNIANQDYICGNSITLTKTPYEGKMYCITVPSSAFLVRYGDIVSVTGNCHAACYSEITRVSFENPAEVIEDIIANQDAIARVSFTAAILDNLKDVGIQYSLGNITRQDAFPHLYKGIVGLLLLERLQFIASFAITFALGEAGMFIPIANAVRKICSDEIQIHAAADVFMLRELRNYPEWKEWENNEEFQKDIAFMVDDVIEGEMIWTTRLFRDGRSIIGINEQLIKDWVIFNGEIIKEELGIPVERTITENPLPWIESWLTLNKLQQANQETDSLAYKMGAIDDDSSTTEFDF